MQFSYVIRPALLEWIESTEIPVPDEWSTQYTYIFNFHTTGPEHNSAPHINF